MATAEARTTLFSSVFMSSTVCLTVASKVASSMTSMPLLAWPRATRPARLKRSERNAIFAPLLSLHLTLKAAQNAASRHHVHQQEMHAGENVVFVVRAQILQFAEIVEGDGDLASRRFIE